MMTAPNHSPAHNGAHPLILRDVLISLHSRTLIAVDTIIPPGDVLTVMGPSGAGKSTLLAFVGGFLEPVFDVRGRVLCGDHDLTDLPPQHRRAGLLFQDPLLFPHMSVGQNMMFAMPAGNGSRADRRAMVQTALANIGLEGMFERDPATLSGGQAARVALARTLLSQPAFLLLDEPFSKLDTQLRDQIRTLVFQQAKASQLPVILVTHDVADAQAAGGQLVALETDGAGG